MTHNSSRQKQAMVLRLFRKIHRLTGAFLFLLFLFISLSGLALGWKKHSGDLILPKTRTGTSLDMRQWKPLPELQQRALSYFRDSIHNGGEIVVDRIEAVPEKGVVKFTILPGYWGIQVDGASGEILHAGRRWSDFFEKVHDGSLVDQWLGLSSGAFKLFYTTLAGLALLVFTITGFWLWYGPIRMRRMKRP
jgi:hypothetical protein